MPNALYIAVDLGAGSGRVFLGGLAPNELLLEEISRFYYPASESDGHLRWNFTAIFGEIKAGLRAAAIRARELGRPLRSIGVNSWGVDYGLIDSGGELIADPVCYRDERTQGVMEQVFSRISRAELFDRTGIQFMPFNTLFQLFADEQEENVKSRAEQLLLIPDLVGFGLTGRAVTEFTNATTTQMVNVKTRNWDSDLLGRLGLPIRVLPEIVFAGAALGPVKKELAAELELGEVQVVVPATHDTASAVAGTPLQEGWAYISSGTWSLVGVERCSPLINPDVARHNFTNEGGPFGTYRFLKNVMGLWILESCRREWAERGMDLEFENLLGQVSDLQRCCGLIYPDDPRFFAPRSMLEAVAKQMSETGQPAPTDPVEVTKLILDSLAFRYASVLKTMGTLTGKKINGVHIVGGGSRNAFLNQMTANTTGSEVATGPVEATVTGNLLVQAIAAGRFASLNEARAHVKANINVGRFSPRSSSGLAAEAGRYARIESRYVN